MKKKKKTTRKSVSVKKTAKKNVKKKTASKTTASAKTPRKKAQPKTSAKSSTATRGNSVDSILKRFQKERSAQETLLASLRKKIEDLEAKTEAYRQQILKLTETEKSTETVIEQLDSRRDAEVSSLLSKLGVQFSSSVSEAAPTEPEVPKNVSADENSDSSDDHGDDHGDDKSATESEN